MTKMQGMVTVLMAASCLCSAAASASAAVIPGNPLQLHMDDRGQMQARFLGSALGEFTPGDLDGSNRAGMFFSVSILGSTFLCNPATISPGSGTTPVVTGSGTDASPYQMSTSYNCGVQVTQTFVYVNGDSGFLARYALTNSGTEALRFRAIYRGGLTMAGANRGQFFFDGISPRVIGAFNDAQGSAGGLEEVASSSWSRYHGGSDLYPSPFDGGESDLAGDGLDNAIDPSPAFNPRVAVQFDEYSSTGLAPAASDTFEVRWFFERYDGLSLSPASGTLAAGQARSVTANSLNHGQPVNGAIVRYAITGANPSSGSASTDASGSATIAWTGGQPGDDTLTAYLDSDRDGVFDPSTETAQVATFSWTAVATPPPPVDPPVTAPASRAQPGCPLKGNVIVASARNDTRIGTAATDIIFGLGGNDLLRGQGGRDCVYGQAGADRLFGGPGGDRLFGGDGADRLQGATGDDLLRGEEGADRLADASGRDRFVGGPGNDQIDARDTLPRDRRRADTVGCGAGRADVARVDRGDEVARDCERVIRRRP